MVKIIKLKGKYNDLELGAIYDGTYHQMGLLADKDHSWKILQWIATEIEAGDKIEVVMVGEDMMEESQRKNKTALDRIVKLAFRHSV
jgi:hypothetical protein